MEPGAYYVRDLVGLTVFRGEEEIGRLRDILQTGGRDVYLVALHDGGELLFPSVPDVFRERNPQAGRIVLEPERLQEVGVYDV